MKIFGQRNLCSKVLLSLAIAFLFAGCDGDGGGAPGFFIANAPQSNPNPNPGGNPTPTPPPVQINGLIVTPEKPTGFVSGVIEIGATVSPVVAAQVEFFVNGQSIGIDPDAPYLISFDTLAVSGDSVSIQAKVLTAQGAGAQTPELTFFLDNQSPIINSLAITSQNPSDAPGTVSQLAEISVDALDASGISKVEFFLDGNAIGEDLSAPFSLLWDSSSITNGSHEITVKVSDATAQGNFIVSDPLPIQVNHPGPTITIVKPKDGDKVMGVIALKATAEDASGVSDLILLAPSGVQDTNSDKKIFQANFDTTNAPEGPFTLTFQATNGNGFTSNSEVTVIVDNLVFDGVLALPLPDINDGNFGRSIAVVADTNQDGFDDVLVGSNRASNQALHDGVAALFRGPNFSANEMVLIANPEPEDDAEFGFSVTGLSDFNSDGFGDLAVGAPGARVDGQIDTGKVFVFYGPDFTQYMKISGYTPQSGERFGRVVAGNGDVNGDQKPDLLVTAPKYDDDSDDDVGRAFVFFGADCSTKAKLSPDSPQENGRFGMSGVIMGDFDKDGKADVAIGSPFYEVDDADDVAMSSAGRVDIYKSINQHFKELVDIKVEEDDQFGTALAGGDLNGDGKADLLIGVIGENPGGKVAWALAPSFQLTNSQKLSHPMQASGDLFGQAVAIPGDVNADGFVDFAVGAPGRCEALLFLGPNFTQSLTLTHPSGQAGIQFGLSLSGSGDVNHDGSPDLAVGAPLLPASGGAAVYFNN